MHNNTKTLTLRLDYIQHSSPDNYRQTIWFLSKNRPTTQWIYTSHCGLTLLATR